ncbi:MAG: metallophosphoesterase family protein [Planctomycetaceae bacterium]
MKILLLADIHANWPALAAIQETFDVCLFLGDVVDYATQAQPCVEWLQRNADFWVRGNHDHSVAHRVPVTPGGMFRKLAAAMRPCQYDQLTDRHLTWLAEMPVTRHVTIGNFSFLLVHATPRDPMDEYLPADGDQWAARLDHVDVDFVCVGHTHIPMDLQLGKTRIVNPGSVGQPRDGDPRAAYAVIEDGRVEHRRVEYDIDETLHQMKKSGMDEDTLKRASLILRYGGNPAASATESGG